MQMTYMVKECMNGLMVGYIKDNGIETRCMEWVKPIGLMAGVLWVCMLMIRKLVMESSIGLMAGSIVDNGSMINRMEKALLLILIKLLGKEFGRLDKGLLGLMNLCRL